ncbi:MAG: hypoxanthine phosphoribosyltransferase [Defluviitaleaceae bacterium]|nr:hypoxanthine phosphoribosyltransferase [Defluviitaleaceae bacterium]
MTELISKSDIDKRVGELAAEINRTFGREDVVVICILKGAFIFTADLVRRLDFPLIVEFMELSSYHLAVSTDKVVVTKDIATDLTGKNVLVVEDIVDTGSTLRFIHSHLAAKNPASLRFCVLLDKPAKRKKHTPLPDFTGFVIPDEFVAGYGLDYDQKHRNIPNIVIKET